MLKKILLSIFIVLVTLSLNLKAQEKTYNPLSGFFGITLDGGLNISVVDPGNRVNFPTVRRFRILLLNQL